MKVDWKAVSRSEGYRSLKAAYIKDLQARHRSRSKKELYERFQWVIGRAMHYAERQGWDLHFLLNQWELERQGWWFGWYTSQRFRKLPSGKPRNVKPMKHTTSVTKHHWRSRDPVHRFKSLRSTRQRQARIERKDVQNKKPRWSAERKNRQARYRYWRQPRL